MTTWGDIKAKVQRELNLQDELFITPQELLDYCQDAIQDAEAEIHKLNIEDQYFEAVSVLSLVSGQRDYAFPDNIYGNKITRIVYSNGDLIYQIPRNTLKNRYEDVAYDTQYGGTNDLYRYMILNNNKTVGSRIRISPTPVETVGVYVKTVATTLGSNIVTVDTNTSLQANQVVFGVGIPEGTSVVAVNGLSITLSEVATATATGVSMEFIEPRVLVYFIRNAFIPVDDTDPIDIPEFSNFIEQYIKVECLKKEKLNPMLPAEKADLDALRIQMVATLTEMVPDQNDEIEKDVDIYRWSS